MRFLLYEFFMRNNMMKVLDLLLNIDQDLAIVDIIDQCKLSRKTTDNIINHLHKNKVIEITRTIGKANLYRIIPKSSISRRLHYLKLEIYKLNRDKNG